MQRQSLWLVIRGLGLALLLALLLIRVATPRTHVIPGDRLTPHAPVRQVRESVPGGRLFSDGQERPTTSEEPAQRPRRRAGVDVERVGMN